MTEVARRDRAPRWLRCRTIITLLADVDPHDTFAQLLRPVRGTGRRSWDCEDFYFSQDGMPVLIFFAMTTGPDELSVV